MSYEPISYFNASPHIKFAIPQEAWYHEFMTPSVQGNSSFDGVDDSPNLEVDRFLLKTGYDLTSVFRYAPLNTMIELLRVTEDEGFSFKVESHYSNDINGQFSINSCSGMIYWTNFKTGISNVTGSFGCHYSNTYSTGEEMKIPTYITCLISHEEKKCFLNITNWSTDAYNEHKINSQCPLNGPYYTWYLTETTFYPKVIGNEALFDNDPWSNGGYGDIGGGDGELDLTSDLIALPDIPKSIMSTGFVQLYTPTFGQINELSDFMWGDGFLDNVLKLWNDPMDIILNLAQFPFIVPSAGSQFVTAGNVVTNVSMNYPANQYVTIDCGSLDIKHFYNAYVDFEPYTTCEIFLPYIGFQTLSMDEIMGKKIHVVYRVDLATGACCAYISCNDVILYQFAGNCATNIPVSAQSFQAMAQSLINIATSAISAPKDSKGNVAMNASAAALFNSKPGVSRSGSVSSNTGIFGPQKPYLVFNVPRTCLPKGQNKYLGYPTYVTFKLGDLEGMTLVEEIILENCTCTEDEKSEIVELLKGGVIL